MLGTGHNRRSRLPIANHYVYPNDSSSFASRGYDLADKNGAELAVRVFPPWRMPDA